jgi:hypothetical protein
MGGMIDPKTLYIIEPMPRPFGFAVTVSMQTAYSYRIPGADDVWPRAKGGYFWLGATLDDEYLSSLDRDDYEDDDWRDDDDE